MNCWESLKNSLRFINLVQYSQKKKEKTRRSNSENKPLEMSSSHLTEESNASFVLNLKPILVLIDDTKSRTGNPSYYYLIKLSGQWFTHSLQTCTIWFFSQSSKDFLELISNSRIEKFKIELLPIVLQWFFDLYVTSIHFND